MSLYKIIRLNGSYAKIQILGKKLMEQPNSDTPFFDKETMHTFYINGMLSTYEYNKNTSCFQFCTLDKQISIKPSEFIDINELKTKLDRLHIFCKGTKSVVRINREIISNKDYYIIEIDDEEFVVKNGSKIVIKWFDNTTQPYFYIFINNVRLPCLLDAINLDRCRKYLETVLEF